MIKLGEKAPDFRLRGDDGKYHTLEEFAGKYLVLYFYPKDDTPECTIETVQFSKHMAELKKAGAKAIGISIDSIDSHRKFKNKYEMKTLLLSDPRSSVVKKYDSYGPGGEYDTYTIRNTFVIGRDGKLLRIYKDVKVEGHVKEILLYLNSPIK